MLSRAFRRLVQAGQPLQRRRHRRGVVAQQGTPLLQLVLVGLDSTGQCRLVRKSVSQRCLGIGKTTLINMLCKAFPKSFGFCTSHTSREAKPGEEDGKDYHFTTKEDIQAGIDAGKAYLLISPF